MVEFHEVTGLLSPLLWLCFPLPPVALQHLRNMTKTEKYVFLKPDSGWFSNDVLCNLQEIDTLLHTHTHTHTCSVLPTPHRNPAHTGPQTGSNVRPRLQPVTWFVQPSEPLLSQTDMRHATSAARTEESRREEGGDERGKERRSETVTDPLQGTRDTHTHTQQCK